MDELPELQSDEEVDALLARLRATIAPPVPQTQAHTAADSATDALTDFLNVQGEATTTIARALTLLAEEVDELGAEGPRPQASGLRSKASSGAWGLGPRASRPASRERKRRK